MSKKWCEYCRVNIDYNREAIRKHEESKLHQQNKQRQINHERRQAKKEHKNTTGYTLEFQKKNNQSDKPKPVPKTSQAHQRKQMLLKMKAEAMDGIKSKIHTFIAQKTEGKFGANIQYPQQPLLTTQKYNTLPSQPALYNSSDKSGSGSEDEQDDDFKMWRIDLCDQTGNPCFINNITGAKLYEKPAGVLLSEQQTARWEQLLKEAKQHEEDKEEVNIGQWQEVEQEDDIFVANAVKQESQKSGDQQQNQEEIIEDIQELRRQLLNSNTTGDKSRAMKKLIQTGKEQTVRIDSFNQIFKKNQEKYQQSSENLKKLKGFLPRKKIKGMTILTGQEFE